jgi:hypothetical protein
VFKRFVMYAEIEEKHAEDFLAILSLIDDAIVHRNWGTLDVLDASPEDADIGWAMVVDRKERDPLRRTEYARQLAALESARHILHRTGQPDT